MIANRERRMLVAVLASALCCRGAAGGPLAGVGAYETGLRHYDAGRYAEALAEFTKAAHAGHRRAQEVAGMMNLLGPRLYGDQVAEDRQAARRWLERAGAQGSDVAALMVRRIDSAPHAAALEKAK